MRMNSGPTLRASPPIKRIPKNMNSDAMMLPLVSTRISTARSSSPGAAAMSTNRPTKRGDGADAGALFVMPPPLTSNAPLLAEH